MVSTQPRKQRKIIYNMPLHKKNKLMSSHMSENLYLKHHKRSYPIKKGDTVKVLRGSFRGKSGKIVEVDRKKYKVAIDGITLAKTDGTQVQFWIHPSNLLITKLDLSDRLRRKKLALSEEEIEETTETEETETTESVVKEENKVVEQNKTEVEQSEQKKAVSKKPAKGKSAGKKAKVTLAKFIVADAGQFLSVGVNGNIRAKG